jgi:acyl-CoA thioester hydrolase
MVMPETVGAHLEDFPVVLEIPVAWGDMDAYRHVNNAVYFRYFESARIAFLGQVGFGGGTGPIEIGPILHSTSARFRYPLAYPDTAWTGARVVEVLDDRFAMEYRVVSGHSGEIAADGTGLVVSYDYRAGRKAPLPEAVRAALRATIG